MAKEEETIVEEREEKMASPLGGKPTVRIARFLRPCANHVDQIAAVPLFPLLVETISHDHERWPSDVLFKGWKIPQKKWSQWVAQMTAKYKPIWIKTGIFDAIINSIYEIRTTHSLVIGLLEVWCPETNTFVLPWGEATMTLEDMLILGGFSVLGEPITIPLIGKLVKIEEEMTKEHKGFYKRKARKASHSDWINYFMGHGSKLEHVAFLTLWLSRYVFPSHPEEVIGRNVFSVAIRLAQGIPIALAPAVLATLYRDLRLLKDQFVSSAEPATVWAPFQLLQTWAWERFPILRPNTPNSLRPGEPRVARWDKLNFNVKLPLVRSTLKLLENFQWRPYASSLNNWRVPSFYKERDKLSNDPVVEDELQSFVRCLRACELVGLDCIEQYLPHRVGMQFGMDQDLPGTFIRANSTSKLAWRTYDKPIRDSKFYVRSRFLDSNVTTRYSEWWKQSMLSRCHAINNASMQRHHSKNVKRSLETPTKGKKDESHGLISVGFVSKSYTQNLEAWRNDDELPLSKRLKLLERSTSIASRPTSMGKPAWSSQSRGRLFCSSKEKIGNREASIESTIRVSKEAINRKTRDATDNLLGVYDYKEKTITSGSQEPGLEARLLQLERELAGLKSQMKTKVEKTPKL